MLTILDIFSKSKSPLTAWLWLVMYISGTNSAHKLSVLASISKKAIINSKAWLIANFYLYDDGSMLECDQSQLELQEIFNTCPTPLMLSNHICLKYIDDLTELYEYFEPVALTQQLISLMHIAKNKKELKLMKAISRIMKQHMPVGKELDELYESTNKLETMLKILESEKQNKF